VALVRGGSRRFERNSSTVTTTWPLAAGLVADVAAASARS